MKNFYTKVWPFCRMATFIIVGLFNTVLIRTEDIGTWKNYLGYFLLILAVIDISIILGKRLRKKSD